VLIKIKFRTKILLISVHEFSGSNLIFLFFNNHVPVLLALGTKVYPQRDEEKECLNEPIAVQLKVKRTTAFGAIADSRWLDNVAWIPGHWLV
jgi:hypothetical protein